MVIPFTDSGLRKAGPQQLVPDSAILEILPDSEDLRRRDMTRGKISRSLWIVGWFAGLLIFNSATHWSQNVDKNGLFIFLEALGRLTTPAELLLSAVVVYGIFSIGTRQKSNDSEVQPTKRTVLRTAYVLVGTLIGVLLIGLCAASWHSGSATNGQQWSLNRDALDNYALLSKSSSELGTEDDGLSPD